MLGGPPQPTLRDLWTPEDEEDVHLFLEAVSRADLLAALSAIEGASAADRLEDDWRGFEKMRTVAIRDLDPWLEARIDELHLRALLQFD